MPDIREELWQDWKIVGELGAGSFGKVYEIHRQNGSYVEKSALKLIRIPSSPAELMQLREDGLEMENTSAYLSRHVDEIRNEIGVMQRFVGESTIVSYEDYRIIKHVDDIGWDILIRMELLTSLSSYLVSNNITEEKVIQIGMDISKALSILHGAGVIHRDIKPQNIFINDRGRFKLGDFGISRTMPHTGRAMSFKGTVSYMAPETFAMKGADARSDIYSLALVLYKCLNGGREPFLKTGVFGPMEKEEAQNLRLKGMPLPEPSRGSRELARVLLIALDPDPRKRFQTAEKFYAALVKVSGQKYDNSINNPSRQNPRRTDTVREESIDYRQRQKTDSRGRTPSQGQQSWKVVENSRDRGSQRREMSVTGSTNSGSVRSRSLTNERQLPSRQTTGNQSKARIFILIAASATAVCLVVFAVFSIFGSGEKGSSGFIESQYPETEEEFSVADPDREIVFGNSKLESAVRASLGTAGGASITEGEAARVTKLDLSFKKTGIKIEKLTGLRSFMNLKELDLSGNMIKDIEELKYLSVEKLILSSNAIHDVSVLSENEEITYLDLRGNDISSMAPVFALTNCRSLFISGNRLGPNGIDGIDKMSSLTDLYMDNTGVQEVDSIRNLPGLLKLSMAKNNIQYIEPVVGLENLEYLDISGNKYLRDKGNLDILKKKGVKVLQ